MNNESTSTTIKNLVAGKNEYVFIIDGKEFHNAGYTSSNVWHNYNKIWFGHGGILQITEYANEQKLLKAICRAWDKVGSGRFIEKSNDSPITKMLGK